MEEKIIQATTDWPEPWEIAEITQHALSKFPESMRNSNDIDLLFDIVYDAINEALDITVEGD
jgi:hypothetical protein